MKLPIQLAGLTPGEEAYVTVAAVDVGILNLTHYQTPGPARVFLRPARAGDGNPRRLRLSDRRLAGLARRRSARAAIPAARRPPPKSRARRRWRFIPASVRVGPDGKADVAFDLPAFNGTVRRDGRRVVEIPRRFGLGRRDRARSGRGAGEPAALPRAGRSVSRLNLRLDNVEGAAGDYKLSVDLHGPLGADAAALHRRSSSAPAPAPMQCSAARHGRRARRTLDVTLTGPKFDATQTLALDVEAGNQRAGQAQLPRTAARREPRPVQRSARRFHPGDGRRLRERSRRSAASMSPGSCRRSTPIRGRCSEQTVSRALPLLYLSKLSGADHAGARGRHSGANRPRHRGAAVASGFRAAPSACGRPKGADDLWLDAFVTDFLTRARENKYRRAAKGDGSMRSTGCAITSSTPPTPIPSNSAALAYAIYVLARNGRPVAAICAISSTPGSTPSTRRLARAQLAAALALLGDRARASTNPSAAASHTLQKARPRRHLARRFRFAAARRRRAC